MHAGICSSVNVIFLNSMLGVPFLMAEGVGFFAQTLVLLALCAA